MKITINDVLLTDIQAGIVRTLLILEAQALEKRLKTAEDDGRFVAALQSADPEDRGPSYDYPARIREIKGMLDTVMEMLAILKVKRLG